MRARIIFFTVVGTVLATAAGFLIDDLLLDRPRGRSSEARLLEAVGHFRDILLPTLAVAIGIAFVAAGRLLRPIRELQRAVVARSRGDMDVRVSVDRSDEVGDLAAAFNDMAARLGEGLYRLERSEELYRCLVEGMQEAMLHADASFRLTFVNRRMAEMLGYERPEDLVGIEVLSVVPEGRQAQLRDEMARRRAGLSSTYETELMTRQGRPIPVLIAATPLRDGKGAFEGVQAVILDLSEIKRLQQEALKAERMAAIGVLTSTVSHELRNPLAVISSSIYFLRRRLQGSEDKVMEHLDILGRQVDAAAGIMDQLRDYARPQPPALEPVELGRLVDEALLPLSPPPGVSLVKERSPAVQVPADAVMIRQVFWNLARNAYQAMPNGGTLEVAVRQTDGWAEVSFRDTGVGIAPEHLEHLFNPLHSTKATGFGLGLVISKRTVEKHGGQIAVESQPGKGTTFTVRLPVRRNEGSA